MDIKKDFQETWDLLLKHKAIIIPSFCAVLVPFIILTLLASSTGVLPLLREYNTAVKDFDKQRLDYLKETDNVGDGSYGSRLAEYLDKDSRNSEYKKELSEYLASRGIGDDSWKSLFTLRNFVMLGAGILASILLTFYLSCMSLAMIALSVKGKRLDLGSILSATNHFLFRLFAMRLLISLMFMIPILVLIFLVIGAFVVNEIVGFLFMLPALLVLLFLIGYIIYLSIRFVFIVPSMYLDESGPVESISHSYRMTRGHFMQVLGIFAVVYGLNLLLSKGIQQGSSQTFANGLMSADAFSVFGYWAVALLFLLIEAIVLSFENTFLFYAYVDFKSLDSIGAKDAKH
jgi:hypothetical protein